MNLPGKSGETDPRYAKRLAIVVPYRDRAEHLSRFVPHMVTYFQRDKLDRQIIKHKEKHSGHRVIPSPD